MSNVDDEVKLSLKVMINKENDKVLYAEADSDFADVLLSFLTMPLGKIVRLMEMYPGVDKVPVFGSLTSLFHSLEDMKFACFSTTVSWWMLYDPPSSFSDECCKLKINVDKSMPARKFFICTGCSRKRTPLVSMYRCVHECDCPAYMTKQMCMAGPENEDDGVFIKKGLSFLITDDFTMRPVVPGSILQTLLNLGVTITEGAQLRTISLGFNDIMELLKASFQSSTPLSDLLFHRKTKNNDMCDVREHLIPDVSSSDSMNMIVKAWVRTTNDSRNNLYVLEAGGDFVDFLFSLLVIPLGGVEWLLGGDSGLRRIDNLYRSVQDFIDNDCFRESNMKRRLMKPKLPPYCLSKNQMFPLKEEAKPKLCFVEKVADGDSNTTDEIISSRLQFKDSKGGESYVKSSAPFFVDRNLYVYDFCEADVDHLKSDPSYKKLELHIGLKEALVILKASLTSDSAIKESLENLILYEARLHSKDFEYCGLLVIDGDLAVVLFLFVGHFLASFIQMIIILIN